MHTVTSNDGTTIAYEWSGDGPPLIFVGGAFCDRRYFAALAAELAGDFTTVAYDRRGRGDSGDAQPYAVERELEDLDALVRELGGSAVVHAESSGAVLALRAVAHGVAIERLSLIEPPFRVEGAPPVPDGYLETVTELTSTDRNGEAVAYFMTEAVGLPPASVEETRATPMWAALEAMAPTLVYDALVMGDSALPPALLESIAVPALVLRSTASPAWMQDAATATAQALPDARERALDGTFHELPPATLAPVLTDFFHA